jgi:hypothetical protein
MVFGRNASVDYQVGYVSLQFVQVFNGSELDHVAPQQHVLVWHLEAVVKYPVGVSNY